MEIIISIINASIRLSTPIIFAALGGVVLEKSGINALAMEGVMLVGAFGAVIGSWITGNPWYGVLLAVLFSVAASMFRSWLCVAYQANQTVSGVGMNILASGATAMMLKSIWGYNGKSEVVTSLSEWTIPIVKDIPIIGELFGQQNPLVYLLFVTVPVIWIVLNKTAFGLRITTVGEKPEVLASLGLKVSRYRYMATILSGILGGLAGAYLSIGQLSFFSQDMTSGRGYMALAACTFGRWSVWGSVAGSVLFGVSEAIQLRLQTAVRYTQFIQMIPYGVTLLVLCIHFGGRAVSAPAASGKPYIEQQ